MNGLTVFKGIKYNSFFRTYLNAMLRPQGSQEVDHLSLEQPGGRRVQSAGQSGELISKGRDFHEKILSGHKYRN